MDLPTLKARLTQIIHLISVLTIFLPAWVKTLVDELAALVADTSLDPIWTFLLELVNAGTWRDLLAKLSALLVGKSAADVNAAIVGLHAVSKETP